MMLDEVHKCGKPDVIAWLLAQDEFRANSSTMTVATKATTPLIVMLGAKEQVKHVNYDVKYRELGTKSKITFCQDMLEEYDKVLEAQSQSATQVKVPKLIEMTDKERQFSNTDKDSLPEPLV